MTRRKSQKVNEIDEKIKAAWKDFQMEYIKRHTQLPAHLKSILQSFIVALLRRSLVLKGRQTSRICHKMKRRCWCHGLRNWLQRNTQDVMISFEKWRRKSGSNDTHLQYSSFIILLTCHKFHNSWNIIQTTISHLIESIRIKEISRESIDTKTNEFCWDISWSSQMRNRFRLFVLINVTRWKKHFINHFVSCILFFIFCIAWEMSIVRNKFWNSIIHKILVFEDYQRWNQFAISTNTFHNCNPLLTPWFCLIFSTKSRINYNIYILS